jgi:uncharacterized protein YjiS (DUF1127 family)
MGNPADRLAHRRLAAALSATVARALHWQRHRAHMLLDLIHTWRERDRARQELAMMRESDLHDLGISRYDAVFEARKPFWRA